MIEKQIELPIIYLISRILLRAKIAYYLLNSNKNTFTKLEFKKI